MGKRLTGSLTIILLCIITFLHGYTYVYPSFADSSIEQWTSVTTNQELADAFRYYCKSRNLAIQGSVADALTSFTTNIFNTICNTLGIDITALQAHLKRSTDSNGKVQFLFDEFGVTAYNRIFAEFLQNNNLSVGDTVNDENIYSGFIFNDGNGNKCLTFINTSSTYVDTSSASFIFGTPYIYDTDDLVNLYSNGTRSLNFNIYNTSVNLALGYTERSAYTLYYLGSNTNYDSSDGKILGRRTASTGGNLYDGYPCILYRNQTNKFYFAVYTDTTRRWDNNSHVYTMSNLNEINFGNNESPQSCNIYVTTNNNTINNNTYNDNKQTVINNDGDVYNYDSDDDPPINPPSGGGTVTPPSDSGGPDGDISFPDFNFQLPQIDWSLGDLSEKFPFSIPFDLIAFFTVLNAEPQAPHIDANIPLGSWYTWHFQADFSQFNNWATIIRNVEFIAFCIGLIYLTIRLVKG